MENKQVLIDQLPTGKLLAENYKIVEGPMPSKAFAEMSTGSEAWFDALDAACSMRILQL